MPLPPSGSPQAMTPEMMKEFLRNPEVAKFVQSPDFMTKMMEENPYCQQMINKTPGLAKLLKNPEAKAQILN